MKKKIAILEFETHTNVLEMWDDLLADSNLFDVYYFIEFKLKERTNIAEKPSTKLINFENKNEVSLVFEELKLFDLIIINTFHRNFKRYSPLASQNTLVLLHNLNFNYYQKFPTLSNIISEKKSILYFLKLYFKESILFERNVIKKFRYLATLLPKTETNEITSMNLYYTKYVYFPETNYISIVIPGTISDKRRDYSMIFDVLKVLKPLTKLKFTFLGKPESPQMLNKLKLLKSTLQNQNIELVFYENFVDKTEFENEIKEAHLLLCPTKIKTSFYGISEKYGTTKISGNEFDCISNGKIGIFPKKYPNFGWKIYQYSDKFDLKNILENLTIKELKKDYVEVQKNSKNYTMEEIRIKVESFLEKPLI